MKKPVIFKAKTSDYTELITLWEASVTATHHFLNEKDIQHYKPLIFDYYFDSLKLYCLRDAEVIQGFIGLKGNFIQMLFVRPQEIGKGIGSSLINYAIDRHKATTVDVNEQNTNARGFYQKMGFELIGRSEKDSAGKSFPVLSLQLG